MARDASSFRRGPSKFKAEPLVLVVCEDSKSSKTYFEEAAKDFRAGALVECSHCGKTDPLNIVINAFDRSKKFDRVYCAIDRDNHDADNFAKALEAAAKYSKIIVLTSYPCFEFWLLLHFDYYRAPYMPAGKHSPADRVLQDLRDKPGMEGYAKGEVKGLFEKLKPKLADACARAMRTLDDARKEDALNPSTPLFELMHEFDRLGKPKPI